MIWAVVTSLTSCSAENFSRSGTRAIVPSSFMISQITPAGLSPASLERSTAASVCPARCSTPPPLARSGMSSLSISSSAIGRQIRPRPWVAMKFMSSAVTSSAAIVRSPSFSRSSSSQTITIFPALMSSSISSIGLNGISRSPLRMGNFLVFPRLHEPLDVLSYDIGLQVHAGSQPVLPKVGVQAGVREGGNGGTHLPPGTEGEAYAVHAHAALLDRVAQHRLGRPEGPDLRVPLGPHVSHLADAVHVPLHYVPPEPPAGLHRPLEVDRATLGEVSQSRSPERLRHGVEDEGAFAHLVHRQARAVYEDGVPHTGPPEHDFGREAEVSVSGIFGRPQRPHPPDLLN